MAYYDPLTGKKINYRTADVIRAEAPAASKRYFAEKELDLQEEALAQNASQFDKSLELQMEDINQQKEQAEEAQKLATLGLTVSAAPRVYEGAKGLYDLTFGGESEPAVNTAANISPALDVADPLSTVSSESYIDPALEVTGPNSYPLPTYSSASTTDPALEVSGQRPPLAESSTPEQIGLAESSIPAGYEAGAAAVNSLYAPAYTSPAIEALAAEGAASIAPGVGEAAIPALSGGQAAGEVGATAGSTAAEGTSFASGLGTAALMYAPYGLFKAFQKEKPSLRDYWPLMTHEQKLELIKTDPEYVARSGVVGGLGLYRESSVRNLGSGLGTPDAADRPDSGYRALGAFGASDDAYRTSSVNPMERNIMPFERNYNSGIVTDAFGEKYDLGGKPLSFNTLKSK